MTNGALNFNSQYSTHYILGAIFLCLSAVPAIFLIIFAISGCYTLCKLYRAKPRRAIDTETTTTLLDDKSHELQNSEEYMDEPESKKIAEHPLEFGQNQHPKQ